MGRRGESLRKFYEGVTAGDPAYIGLAVVLVVVIGGILYFRFRKRT